MVKNELNSPELIIMIQKNFKINNVANIKFSSIKIKRFFNQYIYAAKSIHCSHKKYRLLLKPWRIAVLWVTTTTKWQMSNSPNSLTHSFCIYWDQFYSRSIVKCSLLQSNQRKFIEKISKKLYLLAIKCANALKYSEFN